jgi:hypothetical protein
MTREPAMRWLLLFILLAPMPGCGTPGSSANESARGTVAGAADPELLDTAAINEMVKKSIDSEWTSAYLKKVYQFDGEVRELQIKKNIKDPEGHGRIAVLLRCPEYVLIEMLCYFADQDEGEVVSLHAGQRIKVRGQLIAISPSRFQFIGCVID